MKDKKNELPLALMSLVIMVKPRFLIVVAAALLLSCSHQPIPVTPDIFEASSASAASSPRNHYILGYQEFFVSDDHNAIESLPLRTADLHLNAVNMLEGKFCSDCISVSNFSPPLPGRLEFDLTLRHPLPAFPKYTAFDVRAVLMTSSDYAFPVSGRSIAWVNTPILLLNPDGYTELFNPVEYPQTSALPPALKYFQGHLAPGGSLTSTLNPFIDFYTDENRHMFLYGGEKTQKVIMKVPAGSLEFGYAVDLCWFPIDDPVIDPISEFPLSANCFEAYNISFQGQNELASETWSYMPVIFVVKDHQGSDTISAVTIEAPDLFDGAITPDFLGPSTDGGGLYEAQINNAKNAEPGLYPLLIRVRDIEPDPNLGEIAAWKIYPVFVKDGWAQTWVGGSSTRVVAENIQGDIYVAGTFGKQEDFDPGPEVNLISTVGAANDIWVSRFDSDGRYLWTKAFGGPENESEPHINIDYAGNIFLYSTFEGTLDFDPGPGVEEHTANGLGDTYVAKYDPEMCFIWVDIFHSSSIFGEGVEGLYVDSDNDIYCSGYFYGDVDLDPGPDSVVKSATTYDAFLLSLLPDGSFDWVQTWGNPAGAGANEVDGLGDTLVVTGSFVNTMDFDPGPDSDIQTATGFCDAYLCYYKTDGMYVGSCTWGGSDCHTAADKISIAENGDCYVGGFFDGTVDFNPGPVVDEREGLYDGNNYNWYLSKFNSDGVYQWVRYWQIENTVYQLRADSVEGAYIVGEFLGEGDFDPGPGIDWQSASSMNGYAIHFNPSGDYLWGNFYICDMSTVSGISFNDVSRIYYVGYATDVLDYDPGIGVDMRGVVEDSSSFLLKVDNEGQW